MRSEGRFNRARVLLAAAAAVGLAAPSCTTARDPAPAPTPAGDARPTIVVIEDTAALRGAGLTPPFWRPSPQQLQLLEARLPAFFRDQRAKDRGSTSFRGPRRTPGDYVFQVVGHTRNGGSLLWINAYCGAPPTTDLVFVMDGGPCYFNVTYDPEAGSFSGLSVNGVS